MENAKAAEKNDYHRVSGQCVGSVFGEIPQMAGRS